MAVLRVHTVPGDEALLRRRAAEVTDFGAALKQLAADMQETLPVAKGIGLAAPQVGASVRMVLIDLHDDEPPPEGQPAAPPPFFLVNPRIVAADGNAVMAEGCLSVPGIRVEVPRHARVLVEAQNLDGKAMKVEAGGLLAIVIQHEMDHLDGKLIADYAAQGCKSYREEDVPEDRQVLD